MKASTTARPSVTTSNVGYWTRNSRLCSSYRSVMARAGRSLVVVLSAMRSLLNSEGGGPDGGACALVAACPQPGSGHPYRERYQLGGGGGASAARVAFAL